ncbi:MAG: nodulation protein NfeD [Candidatus Accumulibacter sp.]|nr:MULTISPECIES: nodulation protein NfeD [unclassified Candidatus Accumulibacter]MBN8514736.1 nodulation protein NfeD [Accumulibacter sp.]MQM33476.1 serine protease [Candidatus Accumulibacter phosphatis]HRE70222.1 nodulation protein NfeD [Accumulibacter sp.]HRE86443.1 nodulation protein NfeD [Accumulibacter sp.]
MSGLPGMAGSGPDVAPAAPVIVLTVQDAIGPASADYVVRSLQHARDQGAPLVVLRIDTPGGLDSAMRQIVQAILASPVPVVSYVSPQGARAASAGTYILYASHLAAMSPATTLGAATPVSIGLPGGTPNRPEPPPSLPAPAAAPASKPASEPPSRPVPASEPPPAAAPLAGDAMKTKQVNDAAAFIRGLAQQHGRNAEWAERAVREAVTLTASEALREKVIDAVAADLPDLLSQIDGRSVQMQSGRLTLATRGLETREVLPDARHRLLSVIANPSFALILMMIGIYGLIFEFSSPGFGVPGTVGAICLLLAMFALQMLPVNYAGLALIVLGIGLMAAELLTPTFGVLGVGGVAAFIAGGLLLFDRDVPGLGVPLPLLFGLAASSAALILLGGSMALRARRAPVVSGREEMIGASGEIASVDGDEVWVQVHGERWRVRASGPLRAGQHVRISAIDGLTLEVQANDDSSSAKGETP